MSQPQGFASPDGAAPTSEQHFHDEGEHQRQADALEHRVFDAPDNAPKVVETIWSFIRSYDQHRHEMPLDRWLTAELEKYPHLWRDNHEAAQVARSLIDALERTNRHKESLQQHLDKGKSSANWLARELEQDAKDNPELNLGEYAGQVRDMLQAGNLSLAETMTPEPRHTTVPTGIARQSEGPQRIWDESSRIDIAREISNQALLNAALNGLGHGARILGQRVWNRLRGVENVSASAALQEFFDSSLKSAKHVGAQVAVSGGVVVAARSGWLGLAKDTPVEALATSTFIGLERAKALYKLGQGDILADTAINAIEQTTMVAARSLAQATEQKGAQLGAQWGMKLGACFGPHGMAIGGIVGGIAGGAAGKAVGKLIEQGGRKIVEVASKVVRKVADTVKEAASAVLNGLKSWLTW